MTEKRKTIILGEDDQAISEVIKIILEEAGFNVVCISEGSMIIPQVILLGPALILLDIWISGENGGEIAKKLKKNEKTKHIPIVMLSANNKIEEVAKSVGADDFLEKPFNMEDLIAVITKNI